MASHHIIRMTVIVAVIVTNGVAAAQSPLIPPQTPPRFYPMRHDMPPGMNANWAAMTRQTRPDFAFVRIELPSPGTVEVFGSPAPQVPPQPVPLPENWCGLLVGHSYRFRIAELEDVPGVDLYPTIEVIDRTHPPAGREVEFSMPVRFSVEEIEQALSGRLVTKVVYVEQPQLASPFPTEDGLVVETLGSDRNLLEAADQRGRPLLIVRLGARTPDPTNPDPHFFGPGGPVLVTPGPQLPPAAAVAPEQSN